MTRSALATLAVAVRSQIEPEARQPPLTCGHPLSQFKYHLRPKLQLLLDCDIRPKSS
ncbi:hypothetical protein DAEQUDRAFT_728531 [Daedalea quercina L-15889]|uniref:Uncharacterized protein n=1 Tax=Daedalea quercina L-15889 TaxID=1314783 RepID=A0A165PB72_9APHY|nr:hypothetical protein DAEQUDRAFT_728531 [Daedalea quercina L-15889]